MSKKTEQIYKSLSVLDDLQNQISVINRLSEAKGGAGEEELHHLADIEFEMAQQLKSLRFWIGSLYSYNGKSTSRAKRSASQENGKKGGRPPKEITAMRRRTVELEQLIDELHRQKIITTDYEKEEKLSQEISGYEAELSEIKEKLEKWNESRAK